MKYICKHCLSEKVKLEKPKPPHLASLICADCNRWIKWVGKVELEAIQRTIQPAAPIPQKEVIPFNWD